MPKMVYLRERYPMSFLVLITNGEGFCLRDFSAKAGPMVEVERQSSGRGTMVVCAEAHGPGNHLIDVPERRIDDYRHWHKQTTAMNRRFLPSTATWRRRIGAHIEKLLAGVVLAWLGLRK